jgi:hypothetical protein
MVEPAPESATLERRRLSLCRINRDLLLRRRGFDHARFRVDDWQESARLWLFARLRDVLLEPGAFVVNPDSHASINQSKGFV